MNHLRRPILLIAVAAVLVACTSSGAPAVDGNGSEMLVPSSGASGSPMDGFTALDPLVDRAVHTANLLPDGRVLVAGGCVVDGCSEATATTEIFDPLSGRFVEGPAMSVPRAGHTSTALASGDVLLVGGYSGEGQAPLATAELYVAATGSFVPAGQMSLGRGGHMATTLPDGGVLVVGGSIGRRTISETAETWDPTERSFEEAAAMSIPRAAGTATALADGSVLVVGGESMPGLGVDSTESYEQRTDVWSSGPSLTESRFKHAAIALADGSVLVVGGTADDQVLLPGIERYDGNSFRSRDDGRGTLQVQ